MPFGFGNLRIKIANGSAEVMLCRIFGERSRVACRRVGVGLNAGMAGAEANMEVRYEHSLADSERYTPIPSGSSLSFEPSGKPVFMTIKSQTSVMVCMNHEVNTDRNFIVSAGPHLYKTTKGKTWIDKLGINHEPTFVKHTDNLKDAAEISRELRQNENRNGDNVCTDIDESPVNVVVSNGSLEDINCRVSYDKTMHKAMKDVLDDEYTTIQPGLSLPFSVIGQHIYMNIVSKSKEHLCVNQEIKQIITFIVSKELHLKEAQVGQLWIDTDGENHEKQKAAPTLVTQQSRDTQDEMLGTMLGKKVEHVTISNGSFDDMFVLISRDKSKAGHIKNFSLCQSGENTSFLIPTDTPAFITIKVKDQMVYENYQLHRDSDRHGDYILNKHLSLEEAPSTNKRIATKGNDHTLKKVVVANGTTDTVHILFEKPGKKPKSLHGVRGIGFAASEIYYGYIRLRSGGYLRFAPKDKYYMTIKTVSKEMLCDSIEIDEKGAQLIMSMDRQLCKASHGELWQDTEGWYHRP